MAFKLALKPTYFAQISVSVPNEHGKRDVSKFSAEFKRVGLDRLNELRTMPHPEVLAEVLVGWKDLHDENGDDVPFNDDTKKALFDIPQAFDALVASFWDSIFGAKAKN